MDLLNLLAPLWLALCALGVAIALFAPDGVPRRTILYVGAASLVICTAVLSSEVWRLGQTVVRPRPAAQAFRIVTFNVWQLNPDPAATARSILTAGADVLTIQERVGSIRTQLKLISSDFPYATDCPGPVRDLVVFSRRPLLEWGCLDGRAGGGGLDAAWATTTTASGQRVTVVTTHFGHLGSGRLTERQSQALAAFVHGFDNSSLIVTGDFNLTPWTYALRRLDRRLRPLERATVSAPTWPGRLLPFAVAPIDHVYAGRGWRAARVQTLASGGSDHKGVAVSFAPANMQARLAPLTAEQR